MSDVTISPGLDEPELFSPGARPQRRFTAARSFPRSCAAPPRRSPRATAQGAVNVREGLYRRTLAVADAIAAFAALALVVVWDAGANLEPWVLLAMPVASSSAKVGGLYERDELVLKKTTLDEAPALLQITGLFALIVFLGQNVFVHAGLTPPLVAELWLASFFAIFLGRVAARRSPPRSRAPSAAWSSATTRPSARSAASSRTAASTPRSSRASASTRCRRGSAPSASARWSATTTSTA